MKIIGLSSGLNLEILNNLGVSAYDFNTFDIADLTKDTTVFIFDQLASCPTLLLTEIVNKGSHLIYVFEEDGEEQVTHLTNLNVFDIYEGVDPSQLDVEFIMQCCNTHKTKEDISTATTSVEHLNTLTKSLKASVDFFNAITSKSKEGIIEVFNTSWNDIIELPKFVEELQLDDARAHRLLSSLKKELHTIQNELSLLKNQYSEALRQGKEVEGINKEIAKKFSSLKVDFDSKVETLNQKNIELHELNREHQAVLSDKKKLEQDYETLTQNYNVLQTKADKLQSQVGTMSETMQRVQMQSDNLHIVLTNYGVVSDILYIKSVEDIPNTILAFKKYPLYSTNLTGIDCSLVIICPKNSTLLKLYSQTYPLIDPTNFQESSEHVYLLEDYSMHIEWFIKNTKSRHLIILDLTKRESCLIQGNINIQNLYLVTSLASMKLFHLPSKDCIGYDDMTQFGISGHIPYLSKEDINTGKYAMLLKTYLFKYLDSRW